MKKLLKVILIIAIIAGVIEIISAPVEWLWPRRWGGFTYWQGNTERREIALTFDDGPSRYTPEILDILSKYNVSATFFVMGKQAQQYPALIQRMAIENHEIGNHTWSFDSQIFKFFSGIDESQISRTQQIIRNLTDEEPQYFRSPGGQLGRCLWHHVRNNHLIVVNGSIPVPSPEDRSGEQLKVIQSVLKPGAIIILHDGDDSEPDSDRPATTVKLLPILFDELRSRDYRVVPLHELLE